MKERLLHVVVCPKCFDKLSYNEKEQTLCCFHDKLMYSIVDNIPVLIEDEAKKMDLSKSKENI